MKAAVVTGNTCLEIAQIEEPQITHETQIKIKVRSAAICNATDNKVYATDTPERNWPYFHFPFIIGHECSGHIVAKGNQVANLEIGDRVVFWTVSGGAFADYLLIDTQSAAVGRINASVTDGIAAIMEMVVGAARLLFDEEGLPFVKKGDKAVIFGLGPAGLIYHRLLKLMGVGNMCGVGHRALRLGKSLDLGADFSVSSTEKDYINQVKTALDGAPDIIVDATGADIVAEMIKLGAPKTRIIPYGVPPFDWKSRFQELANAGISLPAFTGLNSARIALQQCIQWADEGILGLEPIISHRLQFDEISRGLDMCRSERETTLKVVINVNEANFSE